MKNNSPFTSRTLVANQLLAAFPKLHKLIAVMLLLITLVVPGYGQMTTVVNNLGGRYEITADAGGSVSNAYNITIPKPVGATTAAQVWAYTHTIYGGSAPGPNAISFNGAFPSLANLAASSPYYTRFGEITSTLSGVLDAAAPGSNTDIAITENSASLDGVGIIVLWNVPNNPVGMFTIQLGNIATGPTGAFGSLTTNPIDKTIPGFKAVIGVGIGYSTGTGSQLSRLLIGDGVPSQLVSENIGGYDDGELANGALTTLGGFGDDPLSNDADELFDISGFLNNGQTNISYSVKDISPEYDDILVAVYFSAPSVAPVCSLLGNFNVCIGNTTQLTGSGTPAAANPWTSSNTAVATVSNTGLVTGIAAGTTTITYTTDTGCTITEVVTTNLPTEVATLSTVTQPTCTNPNGTFSITNYNAAFTYTVSPSAGVTISGATITAPTGNYTVTADNGICISAPSESREVVSQPASLAPPVLSAVLVTPTCPKITFDLTILITSTTPVGSDLEFHSSITPSTGTLVADPTEASHGVYYAFYKNGLCYSAESTSITITECSLPVTLVSFTAKKEGNIALLNWDTTEETNSDRFEIERSIEAKIWNKIGTLAANGESKTLKKYSFTDNAPANENNYYRLKMIDRDATFAYSSIQSIMFNTDERMSVYSNPVRDILFLKNVDYKSVKEVSIVNLHGQIVYKTSSVSAEGINVENINNGIYMVNVILTNGTLSTHKVIVSR